MKKILVTGGAGYIGSHTVLALLNAGYQVVVVDNLCNGSEVALERVAMLSGRQLDFVKADILDYAALTAVFKQHHIDAVMHFAGLKAVAESVTQPMAYYYNNVQGTLTLLRVMQTHCVYRLVFSSSATIYGETNAPPYVETQPIGQPSSPYGQSKAMIERMLIDLAAIRGQFQFASLRYFNPIGADESGLIGEDPHGIPNNLMPYIAQVAVGKREQLAIFGHDYPTKDGTCLRDYIHVSDLANGHMAALTWLLQQDKGCCEAFNLGTGVPLSVLEVVEGFERYSQQSIKYRFADRRPGDLAAFWADASKAKQILDWAPTKSLQQMMVDTWRWQSANPNGYNY